MSKYAKEITVTDTQIEVIKRGLIYDLEYCLNETDNSDEAYGPCGGYRTEINSYKNERKTPCFSYGDISDKI
ncbi:MAG: hypothetical protein MJZ11_08285 [Lachnospiraceae bacterium]|nr:hypothetical protein [Lachnospiraceae bacterium]